MNNFDCNVFSVHHPKVLPVGKLLCLNNTNISVMSKNISQFSVVFRSLCPSDSEMMDVETPDLFRTVANECRATYVVSVIGRCRCSPISFR